MSNSMPGWLVAIFFICAFVPLLIVVVAGASYCNGYCERAGLMRLSLPLDECMCAAPEMEER